MENFMVEIKKNKIIIKLEVTGTRRRGIGRA